MGLPAGRRGWRGGARAQGQLDRQYRVARVPVEMSVHPDFQAILDVVNGLPAPDYTRPPLELAREMRSAPVMIPPLRHVVAVEVRTVPGKDGHAIPVRIYRPSSPRPHPVLVSMHGGGWVRGTLDSDEFRSHFIAYQAQCAVVSVGYRLAPEYPFPIPFEDCLAVTEWVAAQAAAMGFAPDRIGVAGDSAGANLATAVAIKLRDEEGPRLRCQVLAYPVCDHDFGRPSYLANGNGKLLSRDFMMWCWDQYAGAADRDLPYLSPLRCKDLANMPPALVLTAEYDPLCDEGEAYAEALARAGNEVEAHRLAGLIHAFQSVSPAHPLTIKSLQMAADFAARHLNGASGANSRS